MHATEQKPILPLRLAKVSPEMVNFYHKSITKCHFSYERQYGLHMVTLSHVPTSTSVSFCVILSKKNREKRPDGKEDLNLFYILNSLLFKITCTHKFEIALQGVVVKDVLPHNFRIKKSEHFQGPQNWLR